MTSINTKIQQIGGLQDTTDLTNWENDFVTNIAEKTRDGKVCNGLSEKQIEAIDRIWSKHFA